MSRFFLGGLLVILIGALVFRCVGPETRPLHNDEGVNAVKFGQLWSGGGYKYDPNEHHGPSLAYATLVLARVTGLADLAHLSDPRLRFLDVLFGAGLILLLVLVADGLGRSATLWAGLFTALSPAMVFYSRYYIHEMLLVFFTFLAGGAGWRYWQSRHLGWALLAGAGVGLMHATKETFVLSLAAASLAAALNWGWSRWLDAGGPPGRRPPMNYWHILAALVVWAGVTTLLFSSFFSNAEGLFDSVRTYQPWLSRAGGASPHVHPWSFYFHRLLWFHSSRGPVWSEAIIAALALIGAAAGFARKHVDREQAGFMRFLACYTFALAAAYCLVSYKTPWCLLGFWHGAILLAGGGAVVVIRTAKTGAPRMGLVAVLLAGSGHLAWQAGQAVGPLASDPRNPYVYAQTLPDTLRMVNEVKALAALHPDGLRMLVKVMAPESDYWPLPWYLRELPRVGWWDAPPADPFAPVMIVASALHTHLDEDRSHQMPHYFEFRPGVFFELYVETNLWRTYVQTRPPPGPD